MWQESVYSDGSTLCVWLSNITLPLWMPSFPLKAFPTIFSFLSSPWAVSPQSTEGLSLRFLYNPYSPSPRQCALGCLCPCPRYIVLWQGLSVWFLPLSGCHRSAAALSNSLKCFFSIENNCPGVAICPLLQFPHPLCVGPFLPTLLFFHSFLHLT